MEKRKLGNQEILIFFLAMLKLFNNKNRDHLINAILNELRYPCSQTYYFSCLLLCIILEIKDEQIEEHILRNMLLRLFYKPYPWGILITFIELSKNPKYELMKKAYVMESNRDKIIDEIFKFTRHFKLNKNLDNYVN
jgi:hypothetical protein